MNTKFSVLISLYKKENPEFFKQALQSVFEQTLLPNEVVLVLDGPLTEDLYETLDVFKKNYPEILKTIPLDKNVGLGNALNEGLKHCTYEYVARMDTDDICKRDRFEKQMQAFQENPNTSVIGSWVDEFSDSPANVLSTKILPEKNEELVRYFKTRNPFNHPSVMFKKDVILHVGGYLHFPQLEDYYLWGRLIYNNYKLYNIQESLLWFRANSRMIARRGGLRYAKSEINLFNEFRKLGLITNIDFLKNITVRILVRLLPNSLRKIFYRKMLRR